MAVIGARMEKCDADDLEAVFKAPALLMLLDGPSRRRAAVAFDPVLVGGLIQQQTMGMVMPDAGGEPRAQTSTDAAICAPFLDALLERAALLPETEDERNLLTGVRFGARAEDSRLLLMALEEPEYQIVHLTVDMAGGKRQGQITLCLPMATKVADLPGGDGDRPGRKGYASGRSKRSLNETVLGLNIDLNIALSRLSMPLSAIGELKPGDVLKLGVSAFDQSRILTTGGRGVGRGTLGQIDGVRALRVEYQKFVSATPKRRASDRAELNLPEVKGDGTGTRRYDPEDGADIDVEDMSDMPAMMDMEGLSDLPDLPDLPDMSDLPGFSDADDLPDLPRLEAG